MSPNVRATAIGLFVFFTWDAAEGQGGSGNVYWHIDPGVKTCSMVIDPSLTQDQWHRYTRQVGGIASFKSLASAATIGKKHVAIALDYSITPIDQHDLAWVNTFAHPDENCPLGDQIKLPAIRVKYGLTDKVDVGALWTKAPDANYGMIGAEVKYAFSEESDKVPAAACRISIVSLTGVPDYNLTFGSLDLLVGKKVLFLTPYLGIRESLAVGTETTSKVELDQERTWITQGYLGLAYSIWRVNAAIEYNVSDVNTLALLIGFRLF